MKRMEILCSSQGSTAICSSIDQRSMVRQSHKTLIDQKQQNSPRSSTSSSTMHKILNKPLVPCSSELLPINPKPHHHFQTSRKSTNSYSTHNTTNANKKNGHDLGRRRSSADVYDLKTHRENSSRYLLGETPSSFVVDWFPEKDDRANNNKNVVALEPVAKAKIRSLSSNSNNNNNSSSLIRSSSTRSRHQVVVLRVSLHCKGCEGKVKKHLSKMEGVTSYSTDLAAKKVTVIGDVTPLGVLASVSKVKNAQLWPSSSSSPWSA